MTFLPIVARELRVAARRKRTYLGRAGVAAATVAVAGFLLPVLSSQTSLAPGKLLFSVLSTLGFFYCLAAGMRATSDALSSEKREGTLGLLFLTDLKGYDVVLGKLVSCGLNGLYGLLASVPVLALSLLLGGVTFGEVFDIGLLCADTLVFSLAVGVFVSAISREDRKAMFATGFGLLLAVCGPYLLAYSIQLWGERLSGGFAPPSDVHVVLRASPVYAFQLLRGNAPVSAMRQEVYLSLGWVHAWTWVLLVAAALIIPKTCRERPPKRLGMRWAHWRDRWSYGRSDVRASFRARLLDQNPFYWLAARDRIKAYYVWFFLAALVVIWAAAAWGTGNFIFDWDLSFWLFFLLFVFFKVWFASEVCTRLVNDRASGAFELLLSSPLSLQEMARGQNLALWRQFGRPLFAVLGLMLVLLVPALRAPHSGLSDSDVKWLYFALMIVFVADLLTLKWAAMWHAINSPNVNRALTAVLGRVLLLPTLLFVLIYGLNLLYGFMTGIQDRDRIWSHGCIFWLAIGLIVDAWIIVETRWRFFHQFREVATERYASPVPTFAPILDAFNSVVRRLGRRSAGTTQVQFPRVDLKRWLLLSPALALLLSLATAGLWRYSISRQLAAGLRSITAAGAPIDLPQLENWRTPAAADQNAGLVLQKVLRYTRFPPYLPGRAKPQLVFSGAGLRSFAWESTLELPDLESWVSHLVNSNQPALDLIRQAAALPKSSFPIPWGRFPPSVAVSINAGNLRHVAPLVELDGWLRLQHSDVSGVLQDVDVLFGCAHALAQEPFLMTQTRRLELLNAALALLERSAGGGLSADQLRAFEKQLSEAAEQTGLAVTRCLVAERCLILEEWLHADRYANAWGAGPPSAGQHLAEAFKRSAETVLATRDKKGLEFLPMAEQLIADAADLSSGRFLRLAGYDLRRTNSSHLRHGEFNGLEDFWRNFVREQAELVASLRAARLAMTIERYRVEHGHLPARLFDIPLVNPAWRQDPFSPGTFTYMLLPRGFLVYSVGADGRDDGGAPRSAVSAVQTPARYDLSFQVGH